MLKSANMEIRLFRYMLMVLSLITFVFCSCERKPNRDISADNLHFVHGKSEDSCCGVCESHPGCKAYAWNDYKGGTCWLKATAQQLVHKKGVSVGILDMNCERHKNTDIGDEANMKAVKNREEGHCCDECRRASGCQAYAWSDFEGGTCWLKSAKGPLIHKPGVSVGLLPGAPLPGWRVLKHFTFNNMNQVRDDWEIKKWGAGFVNNELQAYVDNPTNIYVENNNLVIKALEKGKWVVAVRERAFKLFCTTGVVLLYVIHGK